VKLNDALQPALYTVFVDEKLSKSVSRLRQQAKRLPRANPLPTPRTNRGVWSASEFQYYISKMASEAAEPCDWAMLGEPTSNVFVFVSMVTTYLYAGSSGRELHGIF